MSDNAQEFLDAKRDLERATARMQQLQRAIDNIAAQELSRKLMLDFSVVTSISEMGGRGHIAIALKDYDLLLGSTYDVALLTADHMEGVLSRLKYAITNQDAALSFAKDGTPKLINIDGTTLDHETLFKLGGE